MGGVDSLRSLLSSVVDMDKSKLDGAFQKRKDKKSKV